MENTIEGIVREKEEELIGRYFGGGSAGAGGQHTVEDYPKELPLKIEAEFREFLAELWKEYSDQPLVLEERKLRWLMTEDDREAIDEAYKDAKRVTLWERITNSNHEDVTYYRGLQLEYTKDLLMVIRHDFLEEITGRDINCKAFEED